MPTEDICTFITDEAPHSGLQFRHFVYEASYSRLKQPFVRKYYCLHLIYRGSAVLKTRGAEYPLAPGTLFCTFPGQVYFLEGDSSLTYLYISFKGPEAAPLLARFRVLEDSFLFPGMDHLPEFWMNSIRRITDRNAAALPSALPRRGAFVLGPFRPDPGVCPQQVHAPRPQSGCRGGYVLLQQEISFLALRPQDRDPVHRVCERPADPARKAVDAAVPGCRRGRYRPAERL